jgi:hypothetical protein
MRDDERPPVLAHQRFEADRSAFSGLDLAARFVRIHETNLWGAETSRSGLGSETAAASVLTEALPGLLRQLGVRSLLDAPCGDAVWINRAVLDVEYVGVDIVPALVDDLSRRAAAGAIRGEYIHRDITCDALPRADAVLCRDCLVHLSFANVRLAIENFRRSGATWLITTTFPEWQTNRDCEDGDWRPLDFGRAPFSWRPPQALLDEACVEAGGAYRDKSLGVWRLADL